MSNFNSANPQVHLHWVRESPLRALELPVSCSLLSLDALPVRAQSAVRATGLASVELHLPPFRPAHTPDPDAWFGGLHFRQDAAGRLIATHSEDPDPLATMAFHQAIVLVMRAVTGDATPLTIVAESAPSPLLRRPLADRYCCGPGGGLRNAPAERAFGYNRAYKAFSQAIQTALRAAVPPAHVVSIDQFSDRDHVFALLAWGAAEPVTGRHVDELGVEVLKPQMFDRAFKGLARRLAVQLTEVQQILLRHRADPAIRNFYKPDRAARITAACRRRSRYMQLLFSNEVRLITSFVQFCARVAGWREQAGGDATAVYREVRATWEEIESLLRRFYQRHHHSALGSLLLLEAVRTLEAVDLENENELRGETSSRNGRTGIYWQ